MADLFFFFILLLNERDYVVELYSTTLIHKCDWGFELIKNCCLPFLFFTIKFGFFLPLNEILFLGEQKQDGCYGTRNSLRIVGKAGEVRSE